MASVQTDIQKLKKDMDLMKKWYDGHSEYFGHLESLGKMPKAYESFLCEIIRRRAYNKVFEMRVATFTNEMASFRADETRFLNF